MNEEHFPRVVERTRFKRSALMILWIGLETILFGIAVILSLWLSSLVSPL